jgi:Protein of unknown function (DUF2785)
MRDERKALVLLVAALALLRTGFDATVFEHVSDPSKTGAGITQWTNAAGRGREFWKEIIRNDYNPPNGESVPALAQQLSRMLGSSDPDQRDETAYAILANWVYEKRLLAPDDLRPLIAEWRGNLKFDIGSVGTDSTFRGSFSALMLSVVIARDNAAPFLAREEFRDIFNDALRYLNSEKDLRGYDPDRGWYHSAAHTADLLKFMGRSRYCDPADQEAILDGIIQKLRLSAVVFSFGKDERFARALLSFVVHMRHFSSSRETSMKSGLDDHV